MGRPRKPTAVLELTGAFRKNPKRKRTEPESTGAIGDPPAHFNREQAAIWRELVSTCSPGVLQRADRLLLEIAVVLTLRFRKQAAHMSSADMKGLISVLARMGMSPADRSRVGIIAPEKKQLSEFEQLAAETKPAVN
jgi:phage terminase small subunit